MVDKPVCHLILGSLPDVLDERKLFVSPAAGPSVGLETTRVRKIADTRPPNPQSEANVDHHNSSSFRLKKLLFGLCLQKPSLVLCTTSGRVLFVFSRRERVVVKDLR